MKIIDLLNKIANGDRPNFRFKGNEYIYDKFDRSYKPSFLGMFKIYAILNNEVEIIESQKHKIPKKLNPEKLSIYEMCLKINEILDYLEVNND
jgi:hypothetical protein